MAYKRIDRKSYKYYCLDPRTGKLLTGWEYREDAKDYIKQSTIVGLKIYTRKYLERTGTDPKQNKNWGAENIAGVKYPEGQEVVLAGDFRKNIQIPEIKVRYNRGKTFGKIRESRDVYQFLKRVYGRQIGIQEHFVLLLADRGLNILGYYKHTVGTPTSALADIPMLMGIVLKSLTKSFIISHNHPAGSTRPSDADIHLTKQFQKAAKELGLTLLDHIIATANNGYYSFADERGLGSIKTTTDITKGKSLELRLREEILHQLQKVNSNPSLTPGLHKVVQDENGYSWAEKRIIQMMMDDGLSVSACIPQIESEL